MAFFTEGDPVPLVAADRDSMQVLDPGLVGAGRVPLALDVQDALDMKMTLTALFAGDHRLVLCRTRYQRKGGQCVLLDRLAGMP